MDEDQDTQGYAHSGVRGAGLNGSTAAACPVERLDVEDEEGRERRLSELAYLNLPVFFSFHNIFSFTISLLSFLFFERRSLSGA